MQKLLLFLAVVWIIASPRASAQYAFQDAVSMENALKPQLAADTIVYVPPLAAYYKILERYLPAGDTTAEQIKNDFAGNPFLRISTVIAARPVAEIPQAFAPGGVGNLDVTNIAGGLAALLVDRAKQELTIAFFNRFKTLSANTAFGVLFPTTTNNLGKLLSYAYPQLLPILRNGFFSDLRALPGDIAGLLDIDPYKNLFAQYPALRIAIRSLKLIAGLQNGASTPAGIFDEFAQFPELKTPGNDPLLNNLATTARLAALFSQSLRSSQPGEVWISPKDLKPLLNDPVLSTIYLGLLWQSANTANLLFYPTSSIPVAFTTLLGKTKSDAVPFLDRVNAFIAFAGQISSSYKIISTDIANSKTPTNAGYYNFIGASIDAIDTAFGIADFFQPGLNVKPYLALARTGNAIYKDIYSQQYTQAVSDGLDFLDSVGKLAPALHSLADFAGKARPYVMFMGNLLEASSSADVQAALDNAILPVGSSAIKKNTRNNIALQAYLGAYAVIGSTNSNATGIWSDRWGVTAPIGFSYTPGFLSRGKLGSLSIFWEVFDLGAIVDYDLRADTVTGSNGAPTAATSKSYSVKLGQIFSPGGYLVYGAGANLPLALGIGAQYGPGLSHIDATGQATVTNPSWRWNITLTVDLPLFNLLNISKTSP